MKHFSRYGALLAILMSLLSVTAQGDEDVVKFDVGWLLFGDLYHLPGHHLAAGDGATGAVVRRGYLTFDADFSDTWFGRLRFELNQSGEFDTYDFEVDFKDLYLGRRFGRHQFVGGLTSTLTYDVIEAHWGLRYLMRTPMDLQGVPSRDTGVTFKGPLNDSGSLGFRAMYGSGVEFGADSSDSRKWMAAFNWKPTSNWVVDFYVDFEDMASRDGRNTVQGFIAYSAATWRWGLQYSNQDRGGDKPLELASAYLVKGLGERSSLIGRIDRLIEPSPKGDNISYIPFDPSAPATLFLAGYEYRHGEHFRITPNLIVIDYDRNDEGSTPKTDVHVRLTLFIDFD